MTLIGSNMEQSICKCEWIIDWVFDFVNPWKFKIWVLKNLKGLFFVCFFGIFVTSHLNFSCPGPLSGTLVWDPCLGPLSQIGLSRKSPQPGEFCSANFRPKKTPKKKESYVFDMCLICDSYVIHMWFIFDSYLIRFWFKCFWLWEFFRASFF